MKGHLRKRGNGWELRAYVGRDPVSGRTKYVTRTVHGTKREAEDELVRLLIETTGGGHAAHDATVADLVLRWFEAAKADLSPTTVRGYQRYIDKHIVPGIGRIKLARLSAADLDRFYARLRQGGGVDGEPLAPATVRQVHAIVRRALAQGLRWGWIANNPATLATPPKVTRPQLDMPDMAEVLRLLDHAADRDEQLGCLLRLAVTTGARRGELCGLRWKNVDLDACTMVIARSVVEAEHGRVVEKDTKTHAIRRVALDESSVQALRVHRRSASDNAEECGVELDDEGFVFSKDPDGKRPLTPGDVTKAFISVRNELGLSLRLHDLRHFAATQLLAAGVPVRTVSGRLGHANAATTLGVYAHFLEASDREAASTMDDLIAGHAATDSRARKRSAVKVSATKARPRPGRYARSGRGSVGAR